MTSEQIKDFENWHNKRMMELNYPPEIVRELTRSRNDWIARVKRKEQRDARRS